MAELLIRFLAEPSNFIHISSLLQNEDPPPGITAELWQLRHELPLHIINYLRESTARILSQSSPSGQTPSKTKYDYCSPVKSLRKPAPPPAPTPADQTRKPKKKVKLFPAASSTTKTHKSFSDVEERLSGSSARSPFGVVAAEPSLVSEGVFELPITPVRSKRRPSGEEQPAAGQQVPQQQQVRGKRGTAAAAGRQTPSPQAFNLGDFLVKSDKRKGRSGTPRSPAKAKNWSNVKSSTPNPTVSNMPRIQSMESRLASLDIEEEEDSSKENQLDLRNCDMFPSIGEVESKKKRIKPIPILRTSGQTDAVFGKIAERPAADSSFRVAEVDRPAVEDRGMMLEAASLTPFKASPSVSITRSLQRSSSVVAQPIIASPEEVVRREELDLLVILYSHILHHNLMPNLTVELFFAVELLLIESFVKEEENQSHSESLFGSVHNCVYFAANTLQNVGDLLENLERRNLKLLLDNPRLALFAPALVERLQQAIDREPTPSPQHSAKSRVLLNVSFQSETDNRSNFPSSASFHDFKKQRDKFYTLVRRWGEHPRGKEYDFVREFGEEVWGVMSMHPHSVNYTHFAQLFMHQLRTMCRGEQEPAGSGRGEELSSLRHTDPVKYARLTARLITPGGGGGPSPPPTFPGDQEFFRDFVVHCKCPQFVVHLRDVLATEILRLNHLPIDLATDRHTLSTSNVSCLEQSTDLCDVSGREGISKLLDVIHTLRLFGKFLGLLEFFPYSDPDTNLSVSGDLPEFAYRTRENTTPALNVMKVLNDSCQAGQLSVSLPWVLEYLAQMDPAAPRLEAFRTICLRLVIIYQTRLPAILDLVSPTVSFFLSTYLGWLLEREQFPRDLLILAQYEHQPPLPHPEDGGLDGHLVVGQSLLLQCCPWVGEVHQLLAHRPNLAAAAADQYRKITPIAAPMPPGSLDQVNPVQKQLQENFFQNQPGSVSRTVEFLSERLASNVIRQVRQEWVPAEKARAMKALATTSQTANSRALLGSLAMNCLRGVRNQLTGHLESAVPGSAEGALAVLLPSDTHPYAQGVCVRLVVGQVGEKVLQWTDSNVTLAYFTKELQAEADRIARLQGKEKESGSLMRINQQQLHDSCAPPPSQLLIRLQQDIAGSLLNCSGRAASHSPDDLQQTVADLRSCLTCRADLTPLAQRALLTLSMEWAVSVVSRVPQLMTDQLIDGLANVWQLAVPQLASPQLATSQLVSTQLAAPQLASPQLATSQLVSTQLATPQLASSQLATPQLASSQLAIPQLVSPQLATPEIPAAQPALHQLTTRNLVNPQLAPPYRVTAQEGTPHMATSNLERPQLATIERTTSQLGTPREASHLFNPQLAIPQPTVPQLTALTSSTSIHILRRSALPAEAWSKWEMILARLSGAGLLPAEAINKALCNLTVQEPRVWK